MNDSHNYLGGHDWWATNQATAVTTVTVKTVPVATAKAASGGSPAEGTNLTNRLVVTAIILNGTNTNAATTTVLLRDTTGASVFFRGAMNPTTGSLNVNISGLWIPIVADRSIELAVTGAITGQVGVTLIGKTFPATTPLAQKYDGTA